MTVPIVYIVDDDEAVRDSLSLLLETAAIEVECHPNAESFLCAFRPEQSGCVVLDVRMGAMSGPELHMELNRRGCQLAVIYLTAHGDIPMTVRAMKSGAMDFLTKPVDGALLLKPGREGVKAVEAPRGESIHYVLTGENNRPYRWRVRAPSYMNLASVPVMIQGVELADVPIAIASYDPCSSCTERLEVVNSRSGEVRIYTQKELHELSRKKRGR